jgi:ATP-binding cassette subfamily F protein 3
MLRLEEVTLAIGTREVLDGATMHLHPGERAGLVGPNGAGKTTLLRLLVGELEAERGVVVRRAGAEIGYLPQKAVSGSTKTVWEEAASALGRLQRLAATLKDLEQAVSAGRPGAIEKHAEATEAFRLAGGWAMEERVGSVLHGLGFRPEQWHQACDTFSGGWQMRIALARLLLAEPDVWILDEPTNHLDLAARTWLAEFLVARGRTVLLVSHDRWFLDRVCDRTIELRHGRLDAWKGNLSAWLAERERRAVAEIAAFEAQQAEIAKLQGFVDRFGAKATKASQAQSRVRAIERIERLDAPTSDGPRARLALPEAPGCAEEVVVLDKATVGWSDVAPLVQSLDLTLLRGERLALIGPNGIGKSTLLAALAGTLALQRGRRRLGRDVRIGWYRQDVAQALDPVATPLEVVHAASPLTPEPRVRSVLGALGLRGDAALRRIGDLSGGEKARVVLASFVLQPANLLLLDEPTNHLDAVTVEVLADALAAWGGALVLVSHDRYLVERLATRALRFDPDGVVAFERLVPEVFTTASRRATRSVAAPSTAALGHEERKRRQREAARIDRRSEQLFEESARVESQGAHLDEEMVAHATDPKAMRRLAAERDAVDARLMAILEELETLDAARRALDATTGG